MQARGVTRKSVAWVWSVAVLCLLTPARVDVARAASLGVYADPAGTQACVRIAPDTPTTLYVVATLDERLVRGVRGAEFRLEIEHPQGWFLMFTPPDGALHVGNPIDADGRPCDGAGVTLAFPDCRAPDVGPGRVALGTVLVTRIGGEPTHLLVKRHIAPGNPNYPCPLLIECNEPRNDKHCVQLRLRTACDDETYVDAGPPGNDAVFFATALNATLATAGYATPARHPERELLVGFAHVPTLPDDGTFVRLEKARSLDAQTRRRFEVARVAEMGRAFPSCRSVACATPADVQWCASVARVGILRFNHPRTARKAIEPLYNVPGIEFVLPAGQYVVAREAQFRLQTDLQDGMSLTGDATFHVTLSKPARLHVEMLDVAGRVTATLHDGFVSAGEHEVSTSAGGKSPRGVFTLRVRAGGQETAFKVVKAGG